MTAQTLLEELRQLGASVAVVDGERLRIEAPRGRVTPALRNSLSQHKDELLALLAGTLPAQQTDRLGIFDCLETLTEIHAGIRADYVPGALTVLDTDPDLRQRFQATEDHIDKLARVSGGPVELHFRNAIEAHAAIWREMVARYRAHLERQAEQADRMPDLPVDTVGAVGISYGDGEPGTWDAVRRER